MPGLLLSNFIAVLPLLSKHTQYLPKNQQMKNLYVIGMPSSLGRKSKIISASIYSFMTKPALLISVASFFYFAQSVNANRFYFSGSGIWSDQSKWSPAYPGTTVSANDTFYINPGAKCNTDSVIRVAGVLYNQGSMTIQYWFKIVTGGLLVNEANAVFINSSSVTNNGNITNNGLWTGNGAIENDFTNDGVLRTEDNSSNTPAKSKIDGNYIQNNNSSYAVLICGIGGAGMSNGNSQLDIVGSALVNGTIDVQLGNGFIPSLGDSFIVMTYNNKTGAPSFNYPALPPGLAWMETINANNITVSVIVGILPVELINFKLNRQGNAVLLNWQTANENNTRGFDIERKNSTRNWTAIGFVNGAGNSSALLNYLFVDKSPSAGINYYRLRQEDLNGQTKYSPIRTIRFDKDNSGNLVIYPNPSRETVYIITDEIKSASALYSIMDTKGTRVIKGEILKQHSYSPYPINISHLSKGIYVLHYTDGENKKTAKFIIE